MPAKVLIILLCFWCRSSWAQPAPVKKTQIITSGGKAADSVFTSLLVGPNATVVFIPTAASALRSASGVIWNPDEETNKSAFKSALESRFQVKTITLLHTRDRNVANSEAFVAPITKANAVWIASGNPGRFMATYRGTLLEKELRKFVQRGGVVAGESAGAIVQGEYTVRGNPDKPVLMVKGSEQGLGLLPHIAINPHLTAQKRENELITVIDRYPKLTGIGIDDETGILIQDGIGIVFGKGRVAIFDNKKHEGGWYYYLKPGDKFDFALLTPAK